jgi:IS30 family transposase
MTGLRWGPLPGRSVGRKPQSPGSCSGTHSPRAGIRRFTPPEPINCAGGVKRSSNERPLYVCSWVIGSPRDGRPNRSPVGWLKAGNEPRLRAIGCETIYAFIYRTGQRAEALWRYLTRRHKRRRPRRARASRDTIRDRASIHDRPKTIESRGEAGHWEGDLIICKRTRPVLVLHERKSRVTLAARLTGKTAAETISAMLAVFGRIDPHLRRSITFDNDTAFAQHGLLRTMRDMTTWFCDAYASWQKGGVENANGRLRRWLPRHLDIDRTSDQDIQEIVLTTNLTPRKCLGFKTPFQALLAELGKDVSNPLLLTSLRFAPESRERRF